MNPIIVPDFVLPTRLLDWPLPAGIPDPGTASGGFDGIYQFANSDCFDLVTSQLALTYQAIPIDGQMLANLRALGTANLHQPLAGYISGTTAVPQNAYVVLAFTPQDILFTTVKTTCIIEYSVTAFFAVIVSGAPGSNGLTLTAYASAGASASMTPPAPGSSPPSSVSPYSGVLVLNLPNGATSTVGILATLATGVLRLPGTYNVQTNLTSATIDTYSTLELSQIEFVNTSGLLPAALASSDPLGILATLRASLRPYTNLALVPEICPLGLNAGTNVVFTTFEAQVFPTGLPTTETASSVTVALTVSPTVGSPADVPSLVSKADYAIVASAVILNGLAVQRWTIGALPKSIASSATVSGVQNGQPITATITGTFNLLTLAGATITYNSNTRSDVILIQGTGQQFPLSVSLSSGQTLTPQGPNDPLFQPGPLETWTELASLVVNKTYPPTPEYDFVRGLTDNFTSLLGRPFTGSVVAEVFQVSMSAPRQRILLLANVPGGLTAASA